MFKKVPQFLGLKWRVNGNWQEFSWSCYNHWVNTHGSWPTL